MALIFCDSFDHYGSGDVTKKWDIASFDIANNTSKSTGKTRRADSQSASYLSNYGQEGWKYVAEFYNGFVMGFAFYLDWALNDRDSPQVYIYDAKGYKYLRLFALTGSGTPRIQIYNTTFSNYLVDETSVYEVEGYSWNYIEVKAIFHATNGSYEVRLNEQTVLQDSGIKTLPSFVEVDPVNGPTISSFQIVNPGGFQRFYIDDLYFCDLTGSVANDFLGDVRVDALYPEANGYYNDFTTYPLTNSNWENAGQAEHTEFWGLLDPKWGEYYTDVDYIDGDTSYTQSTAPNDRETYVMQDIPTPTETIHGIQQVSTCRKSDSGLKEMNQLLRVDGVDHLGEDVQLYDNYRMRTRPETVSLNTGINWTVSEVNGIQSGIKVI